MKEKKKKRLIAIWKVLGILSLAYFIFWFVKIKILHQYGMVSDAIRFTIAVFVLAIYLLITGIFFLIKLKKKKSKIHLK